MRSTPSAPIPTALGLDHSFRDAWRMGWEEGYRAALQHVTTEQQQLFPSEAEPW